MQRVRKTLLSESRRDLRQTPRAPNDRMSNSTFPRHDAFSVISKKMEQLRTFGRHGSFPEFCLQVPTRRFYQILKPTEYDEQIMRTPRRCSSMPYICMKVGEESFFPLRPDEEALLDCVDK